jgi:non-lysosomal glucosylceramidase
MSIKTGRKQLMPKLDRLILLTSFILLIIFSISVCIAIPVSAAGNIPIAAWVRDINAGGYKDGAPIGGLGAGTITWRFDGKFYKRLYPGLNNMFVEDDWGFYMVQKPSGGKSTFTKLDAGSLGSGQASYYSLFPKAWVDYYGKAFLCKARVTQFSPIIPNDYQRTSYPVGVYKWEITNPTSSDCEVSIMLTWSNASGTNAEPITSGNKVGLVLRRGTGDATRESQLEFTLAGQQAENTVVTYSSAAALTDLVADFEADGTLNNKAGAHKTGAIAFTVKIKAGKSVIVPIILSWDMPITLDDSVGPHKWYKEYTRYFGRSGLNSRKIAGEALENYLKWEQAIDVWQNEVLNNKKYPAWLKTTLFNELYYYFIGGTIWEAGAASSQPDNPDEDMFSHLECFAYPYYGTSDVRFYGSWALFLLWPEIDKQCIKQYSDSIHTIRKDRPAPIGTCAHDFGSVNTLFRKWNEYTYKDTTDWKDLNSKFVLMVYRDWALTGKTDSAFLNYCWPSVQIAMNKVRGQDTDNDGLPNSDGTDQTYDTMELQGNTAYCGGLFIAACEAAKELALAMGDSESSKTYQSWFDLGKSNYESKLWTGTYYNIDTHSGDKRIMADQLCGHWYARACGLPGIVSEEHATRALRTIYDFNLMKFDNGNIGPVNVMFPNGKVDETYGQTQEVWVGVAWTVAASMIQEGLYSEAARTSYGIYNTIWNTNQLWFRTPEAWQTGVTSVRAPYYMRATSVWAMKHAYDISPNAPDGATIPAKLEAENYDQMNGVAIEVGTEGGRYVSGVDAGDWIEFNTYLQNPGKYRVEYRVASSEPSGVIQLLSGATVLRTTTVGATGSFQTWKTISAGNVSLKAGTNTIRIFVKKGSFSIDWVNFTILK